MGMDRLFIKGMTWGWASKRSDYRTPEAADSLEKLKQSGCEWVAISFWTWQDNVFSTAIHFDYGYTVTDHDIVHAVEQAKRLGLKVCLKPVVNSRDGIWRGLITFPKEEPRGQSYWDEWFRSYTNFLVHYAELAEALDCELFCIGCEMVGTEHESRRWRDTIARVREVYSGPLVYNANHGKEGQVEWFSEVDLIGTSAYYPVGNGGANSEQSMIANWLPIRDELKQLHERFDKPVLFMEIGCRSARGCSAMPWDFKHTDLPFSEEEQADFYSSVLHVFWDEPWFAGFFWWDWSTKLYPMEEAKSNRGFDIYGKRAQRVLEQWYRDR